MLKVRNITSKVTQSNPVKVFLIISVSPTAFKTSELLFGRGNGETEFQHFGERLIDWDEGLLYSILSSAKLDSQHYAFSAKRSAQI